MDAVLLDTDVFSFLMKGGERAKRYAPHVQGKTISISFITVGELYAGAFKANWTQERLESLEERIRSAVVIPYDGEISKIYGKLKSRLKTPSGSDRVVGSNDLWIASCAVRHSLKLITNNRKHFEDIPDLDIVSEPPPEKTAQISIELPPISN